MARLKALMAAIVYGLTPQPPDPTAAKIFSANTGALFGANQQFILKLSKPSKPYSDPHYEKSIGEDLVEASQAFPLI